MWIQVVIGSTGAAVDSWVNTETGVRWDIQHLASSDHYFLQIDGNAVFTGDTIFSTRDEAFAYLQRLIPAIVVTDAVQP